MNVNTIAITPVDVKNSALATPLTKDGRICMGKVLQNKDVLPEEFLKNCFVDADFISQDILAEKINSQHDLLESQDYDHFSSDIDIQKKYKYHIKQRSNSAQKEQFEKDLLGTNPKDLDNRTYSSIFLIEGPAGSGKTTYANYLLQNDFEKDLCDVETATQTSCGCFGNTYDFKNPTPNPITAIEVLLLSTIHERLARKVSESDANYIQRISKINEVYFSQLNSESFSFRDFPQYRKFFNSLRSFCNKHKSYDLLSLEIYEQIDNAIISSDEEIAEGKELNEINAIKFLLGILMRLYFCFSRIYNKKYILFLDNVERYIFSETGKPYIAVFDAELQMVLNSCYSVADETEDIIYKSYKECFKVDKQAKYCTSFGILIAVRESTLSILKSNHAFSEYFEIHHSEKAPTYVNISNWFDYYKIFLKKIEFFSGITNEQSNLFTHTFNNILNDITLSKWSLRRLLLNLFNGNFRRFFENMSEVFCNYEEAVCFYNEQWDKVKTNSSPEARCTRHLCRKLMIRIVLDYMQNIKKTEGESRGFFDNLMSRCDEDNPSNEVIARSSYARRIITFLDNMNNEMNSRPVAFSTLIKVLLQKPIVANIKKSNVSINDRRISDIAEILSIASQTAKIHTNGVELVTINCDSVILHKHNNSLAKVMMNQWNQFRILGIIDSDAFNIKITPAGSVFAMLFPCFEYFACRYRNNSIPLFMLKSEQERRNLLLGVNNSTSENTYGIYEKAMSCIDSVLKLETRFLCLSPFKKTSIASAIYSKPEWLYDYDGEGVGMVHALRIIAEHLGYLQDYKNFLANLNDDSFDNNHYKNNDGNGVIDEVIEKYKIKHYQIVEQYRSYLEVGNIPNISQTNKHQT